MAAALSGAGIALAAKKDGGEAALPSKTSASAPDPGFDPAYRRLNVTYPARNVQRQTRIEQRVIIRISPRSARNLRDVRQAAPDRAPPRKLVEREMEECIPLQKIAAVQTAGSNRLILFLRDRRVVQINLGKACRARDFYSGFYVEQSEDEKLCVKRDELHSRSGASCKIARMHQLVAQSETGD